MSGADAVSGASGIELCVGGPRVSECPDGYRVTMEILEQLYGMTFDFAVEDSPAAFEHVLHFEGCKVAIFNRPWNVKAELPNENFVRCADWDEIDRLFP